MSFHGHKGNSSSSGPPPVNNLAQQLGKFRKEKAKPTLGFLGAKNKQNTQNQTKLFNFLSKKDLKNQKSSHTFQSEVPVVEIAENNFRKELGEGSVQRQIARISPFVSTSACEQITAPSLGTTNKLKQSFVPPFKSRAAASKAKVERTALCIDDDDDDDFVASVGSPLSKKPKLLKESWLGCQQNVMLGQTTKPNGEQTSSSRDSGQNKRTDPKVNSNAGASGNPVVDLTLTETWRDSVASNDETSSGVVTKQDFDSRTSLTMNSWRFTGQKEGDVIGKENEKTDNSNVTSIDTDVSSGLFAWDFQSAWSDTDDFDEDLCFQSTKEPQKKNLDVPVIGTCDTSLFQGKNAPSNSPLPAENVSPSNSPPPPKYFSPPNSPSLLGNASISNSPPPPEYFSPPNSPSLLGNAFPSNSPPPPEYFPPSNSPPPLDGISPPNSPPAPEYFSPPPSPFVPLSMENILMEDEPLQETIRPLSARLNSCMSKDTMQDLQMDQADFPEVFSSPLPILSQSHDVGELDHDGSYIQERNCAEQQLVRSKVPSHPLLQPTPKTTPTSKLRMHLEEAHNLHYNTMEEICLLLDKAAPPAILNLPKEITDAQALRKKIRCKVRQLEALLKQRGESSQCTFRSSPCTRPLQSTPCGDSFFTAPSTCTLTSAARNQGTKLLPSSSEIQSSRSHSITSYTATNSDYSPLIPSNINSTGSRFNSLPDVFDSSGNNFFERTPRHQLSTDFTSPLAQTNTINNARNATPVLQAPPAVTSGGTMNTSLNSSFTCSQGISSVPNNGNDSDLKRRDLPYHREMWKILKNVYNIRSLRTNQLEAINAAMSKHDCFILMPTGGGKSLCFQVTGLMGAGVTFVISPLRSLIQDQVQRLQSLSLPAVHLLGDTGEGATKHLNSVYKDLFLKKPTIKLVYVTPEKLSASDKLTSVLSSLYKRNMLERIVIDEAHCVSRWGHDFRPDYKKLSSLRTKFPGVPFMALTATATPRVRKDVLNQLKMTKPKWFTQSFNRPNLRFVVKPKKKVVEEILQYIKTKHPHSSGIIYCLSRNDCQRVADSLNQAGISAVVYHAGLTDTERTQCQEAWINDRYKVVCATIAFGMGIDKGSVRYVIHHSMPKSLEGYYQECGRAGRDGKLAECILFYLYGDTSRIKRMILNDRDRNSDCKQVDMDNLFRVVQFCENVTECRRVQLLHYFGEMNFDPSQCRSRPDSMCDTCASTACFVYQDITAEAKAFVESVNSIVHNGNRNWKKPVRSYTLNHFIDILKGSGGARISSEGHDRCSLYGIGKAFYRNDAERLGHLLVLKHVLAEHMVIGNHENVISYLKLGPKALDFLQGRLKLPALPVREKNKANKTKSDPEGSESCHTTSDYTTDPGESTGNGDHSHYWNQEELAPAGRKRKRKMAGQAARSNTTAGTGWRAAKKSVQKYRRNRQRGRGAGFCGNGGTVTQGRGLALMAPPQPMKRFTF